MACFFVPVTEAVLVTAIEKAAEKKELKATEAASVKEEDIKIPLSMKLKWLTHMFGEVPPFLRLSTCGMERLCLISVP